MGVKEEGCGQSPSSDFIPYENPEEEEKMNSKLRKEKTSWLEGEQEIRCLLWEQAEGSSMRNGHRKETSKDYPTAFPVRVKPASPD